MEACTFYQFMTRTMLQHSERCTVELISEATRAISQILFVEISSTVCTRTAALEVVVGCP